jgi:MYXO-CTERM domain-containing protein
MSADDFAATDTPLGTPKAGRSADLDALASYVASFARVPDSPFRDDNGALTDAGRRGRLVFVGAGCTACHGGQTFQDNTRHDTGSILATSGLGLGAPLAGVGFDSPTLLGLWHTGPWLHDGRAATLSDALVAHGGIPALADGDRDDLIAYLLQLDSRSAAADADCAPTDECVRVDGGEGGGEGEGEGDGDDDVIDGGCGCSGDGGDGRAWVVAAFLLGLRRRRRRR